MIKRDVLKLTRTKVRHNRAELLKLSGQRGPDPKNRKKKPGGNLRRTPRHDVVERGHALEQRNVLKRAREAAQRRLVGPHRRARPAPEGGGAGLRRMEAVVDGEKAGLARPLRGDNGGGLALSGDGRRPRPP